MVMDCSHCSSRLDSIVYSVPVSLYRGACIHIRTCVFRLYVQYVQYLFSVLTGASKPCSHLQCSHLSSHCIHVCIYTYVHVHTSLFSVMYDCTYVRTCTCTYV